MRQRFLAAAVLSAFLIQGSARGAELETNLAPPASELDPSIELCAYSAAAGGSGSSGFAWTFDTDFMFMQYNQSGGVQSSNAGNIVGNGDNAPFDFSFAPRFTLGIESASGAGARVRYWFFDQRAPTGSPADFVAVDAYAFDVEGFKKLQLGRSTVLEGFGGVRISEFNLADDRDLDWRSSGVGITTGFELSHYIRSNHRLYAGTRLAVVVGDVLLRDPGDLDDSVGRGVDSTTTHLELATGYEGRTQLGRGLVLVYGAGAEAINWSDTAIKADASNEAYLADAGWLGFSFRVGAEY